MPTYEYKCPKCSQTFEEFQSISEKPIARCPDCGAAAERQISGGGGLLFKGSGFYITDYRSEGYKKAAEKEKPKSKSKTESGSEKKKSSSSKKDKKAS